MGSVTAYTCRDFYLNMRDTHSWSELAREVKMREAKLEKYIKDYIYDKTGETVYLHLEDVIRISHITKRGSITLAILWVNILQHPRNFPPDRFPYSKLYDTPSRGDRLKVQAEDMQVTVYMATGALVIEGKYIYDWFTRRFRDLLDNYDESYSKTWSFIPTPSLDFPLEDTSDLKVDDPNTETEDYLLFLTTSHAVDKELDRKMEALADDLIPGLGNINIDQPLWEGEDLTSELECLSLCSVKDGFDYVYKLWKSLLNRWLGDRATRVYIASPMLDIERLQDVIDICLQQQYQGSLEAIYSTAACDPTGGKSLSQIKSTTIKKYDPKHQTYIEYKILHRILMPTKTVNARFIAGVREDGSVEVLVTSAAFHGSCFVKNSLETVMFIKMDKDTFMSKFVDPIASPVIATSY